MQVFVIRAQDFLTHEGTLSGAESPTLFIAPFFLCFSLCSDREYSPSWTIRPFRDRFACLFAYSQAMKYPTLLCVKAAVSGQASAAASVCGSSPHGPTIYFN